MKVWVRVGSIDYPLHTYIHTYILIKREREREREREEIKWRESSAFIVSYTSSVLPMILIVKFVGMMDQGWLKMRINKKFIQPLRFFERIKKGLKPHVEACVCDLCIIWEERRGKE